MKFNDLIRGTITSFDDKGRGVFSMQMGTGVSREAAIPFAFPSDEIEAAIVRRDRGTFIAELKRIITPSPNRLSAPTDIRNEHPGMIWGRMSYDAQVKTKRDAIDAAFASAGHAERVAEIIPAIATEYYRNRMDYVVSWDGAIGLKAFGQWSRTIDLTDDPLLSPASAPILQIVRDCLKTFPLTPWDNKSYDGDLRYVVVREGKRTDERLVILVVRDATRITPDIRDWLAEKLRPHATSFLIGEQPKITDISYAERFEVVFGNPWLEEEVNGIRYRISPNSFFQTNSGMAAKLQDVVLQLCDSCEGRKPAPADPTSKNILDLYCGLGFFSIALAKKYPSAKIHGVEIDADAITLASHNAEANGVSSQCAFTAAKAEDLSWKNIPADTVILDPPRAGLHPRVIETVLQMKPAEIIYVSCSYHRLVEELKRFKTAYRVESVTALDLFPHTPHVEVVAKLIKL